MCIRDRPIGARLTRQERNEAARRWLHRTQNGLQIAEFLREEFQGLFHLEQSDHKNDELKLLIEAKV